MSDANYQESIAQLVEKVISEYAPQKIVLFGSHSYGEPDRDSDIDLLIIKDTSERFFDRLTRVRQIVSGTHKGIPFDPIVLTPHEVEACLNRGDQFIKDILEKGQVLYAP